MKALQMVDVHVSRQQVPVLKGVHLTVEPGEIHGLVGPNGAGKTTVFLACIGFLPLAAGRIYLLGRDLAGGPRDVLRQVGFVQDDPFVYDHLTVGEFVLFVAKLRGYTPSQRELAQWCDRFALPRSGKLLRQCSLGMRRKAAIVAQLIHRPRLVLMDEPFNGLDANSVAELRTAVVELARQGTAFVISSHRPEDLHQLCSRIGRLADGVIQLTAAAGQGNRAEVERPFGRTQPASGFMRR